MENGQCAITYPMAGNRPNRRSSCLFWEQNLKYRYWESTKVNDEGSIRIELESGDFSGQTRSCSRVWMQATVCRGPRLDSGNLAVVEASACVRLKQKTEQADRTNSHTEFTRTIRCPFPDCCPYRSQPPEGDQTGLGPLFHHPSWSNKNSCDQTGWECAAVGEACT